MSSETVTTFKQLGIPGVLLSALDRLGYESPTPVQARTIPLLLAGKDVIGQAQTGTGKTAAFALPALAGVDVKDKSVQVLVLTPTRELAIQVAEAMHSYAGDIRKFSILPVYGGQNYRSQTSRLQRGVQVVVGTPGRIIDHMRQGLLKLDGLRTLVLDEADEMLRQGFIDDIDWILSQTPSSRQTALFSATMPKPILQIAKRHLNNPETLSIQAGSRTAQGIRQRYWPVKGVHKFDALSRLLETEPVDAAIVFVRTRTASAELAEKLGARGFSACALNGDIPQAQREKSVERLRQGKLDILIATDVAARGLDVERISHVINYDIPYDTESYIHRIGRTGRAGRHGDAILFVAPREQRMLRLIEKSIGTRIEPLKLPSFRTVLEKRLNRVTDDISATLENNDLAQLTLVMERYLGEHEYTSAQVAAALVHMLQNNHRNNPASIGYNEQRSDAGTGSAPERQSHKHRNPAQPDDNRPPRGPGDRRFPSTNGVRHDSRESAGRPRKHGNETHGSDTTVAAGMERYRLEVGRIHGVKPGNIVGAVANEAGIDSQYMGRIQIHEDHSLIDLPEGMPKVILGDLRKARICGIPMRMSRLDERAVKRRSRNHSDHRKHSVTGDTDPRPSARRKPRKSTNSRSAARAGTLPATKAHGRKQKKRRTG